MQTAQKKAQKKYDGRFKKVTFRLDPAVDHDILLHLFMQPNVTKYLKELIRKDICR